MAYCEHYAVCTNTSEGLDQRLKTCRREAKGDLRSSLHGRACPGGFEAERLRACFIAIRAKDCRVDLASVRGIPECRPENMCRWVAR